MKRQEFKLNNDKISVSTEVKDSSFKAEVDGEKFSGSWLNFGEGSAIAKIDDKTFRLAAVKHKDKFWVSVNGRIYIFDSAHDDDEYNQGAASENSVTAPMPGKVIKVLVSEGEAVEESQPVIVVEAMKMEHTLRAPVTGTVKSLHCEDGEQVEPGVALIEFEAAE